MSSKMLGSKNSDSQGTRSKKADVVPKFRASVTKKVVRRSRPSAPSVSEKTILPMQFDGLRPQSFNESNQSALRKIVDRLNVYYTLEEVHTWLNEPHPQLGGEKAIDLIKNDRMPEVLAVIDRLDNTVFI